MKVRELKIEHGKLVKQKNSIERELKDKILKLEKKLKNGTNTNNHNNSSSNNRNDSMDVDGADVLRGLNYVQSKKKSSSPSSTKTPATGTSTTTTTTSTTTTSTATSTTTTSTAAAEAAAEATAIVAVVPVTSTEATDSAAVSNKEPENKEANTTTNNDVASGIKEDRKPVRRDSKSSNDRRRGRRVDGGGGRADGRSRHRDSPLRRELDELKRQQSDWLKEREQLVEKLTVSAANVLSGEQQEQQQQQQQEPRVNPASCSPVQSNIADDGQDTGNNNNNSNNKNGPSNNMESLVTITNDPEHRLLFSSLGLIPISSEKPLLIENQSIPIPSIRILLTKNRFSFAILPSPVEELLPVIAVVLAVNFVVYPS